MQKRPELSDTSTFTYDQINSNRRLENQNYFSESRKRSAFVDLRKIGGPEEELGWKIHISLTENNENIGKAWNLIVPILMNHGIEACKVLKIGLNLPEYQLGKEITIYDQRSPVNWSQLLKDVDTALAEHGIQPGYFAINDKPVEGSPYFSCRNDLDEEGDYVHAIIAGTFNLTKEHHDFEYLRLSPHPKQLPKPSFTIEVQENIKCFYSMLQININNIGGHISQNFSRISNKVDIFDEKFITQLKRKYYLSTDDVSGLQAALARLEKIQDILGEGKLGIARLNSSEFNRVYIQYKKELQEISALVNTEIEQIKVKSSKKAAASEPTRFAPSSISSFNVPFSRQDDFADIFAKLDQLPSAAPQESVSQTQAGTATTAAAAHVSSHEKKEPPVQAAAASEHEEYHPTAQPRKKDDSGGPGGPTGGDRNVLAPPPLPSPSVAAISSQTSHSIGPTGHGETKSHQSALPTYTAVSQSLSAQPALPSAHMHISSGQEKMIMAIADATGLSDAVVEQLSSQQIQNVHRLLHDSEHGSDHISDLIISGLRSKAITIDQVKDISAETKKELEATLASRSTSPNLKIEEVTHALNEISRKDKTPSVSTGISLTYPK